MSKHALTIAAVYGLTGLGVAAWTAHRAYNGKNAYTPPVSNPAGGLLLTVAIWPYVAVKNVMPSSVASAA